MNCFSFKKWLPGCIGDHVEISLESDGLHRHSPEELRATELVAKGRESAGPTLPISITWEKWLIPILPSRVWFDEALRLDIQAKLKAAEQCAWKSSHRLQIKLRARLNIPARLPSYSISLRPPVPIFFYLRTRKSCAKLNSEEERDHLSEIAYKKIGWCQAF